VWAFQQSLVERWTVSRGVGKISSKHELVHSVDDEAIIERVSGHAMAVPVRKTGGVNVVHGD